MFIYHISNIVSYNKYLGKANQIILLQFLLTIFNTRDVSLLIKNHLVLTLTFKLPAETFYLAAKIRYLQILLRS